MKYLSILMLSAVCIISSCKHKAPQPQTVNEEFDRTQILFIKLDTNNLETTDTTTINLDKYGVSTPQVCNIATQTRYRVLIHLYASDELVDPEIIEDAGEHKFFFFATPSQAISSYTYNDGIGLDGIMGIQGAQPFAINILLRHGLDKTNPNAQDYNSATYQVAGGDNDLNITIQLQPI